MSSASCQLPKPRPFSIQLTITCGHQIGLTEQNRTLDDLLHWVKEMDREEVTQLLATVRELLKDQGGKFAPISISADRALTATVKDQQLPLPGVVG
jgi:hypothetical protein